MSKLRAHYLYNFAKPSASPSKRRNVNFRFYLEAKGFEILKGWSRKDDERLPGKRILDEPVVALDLRIRLDFLEIGL